MSKLNYKNISYSLTLLAILVLGVIIIPIQTNARYYYEDLSYHDPTVPNRDPSYYIDYPNYYQAPTYVPAPTPVVYVNPAPTPIVYSNTKNPKTATAPKKVAKAKTVSPVNASAVVAKAPADSNLAANAILGSNSFIPSGLIQWIFFAILVLLAVILVRRIYGGKEKYDAIPMKHE